MQASQWRQQWVGGIVFVGFYLAKTRVRRQSGEVEIGFVHTQTEGIVITLVAQLVKVINHG